MGKPTYEIASLENLLLSYENIVRVAITLSHNDMEDAAHEAWVLSRVIAQRISSRYGKAVTLKVKAGAT